jgi:hypothetical protein
MEAKMTAAARDNTCILEYGYVDMRYQAIIPQWFVDSGIGTIFNIAGGTRYKIYIRFLVN